MRRDRKSVRLSLSVRPNSEPVTISVAGPMTAPINLLDLTPADALERLRRVRDRDRRARLSRRAGRAASVGEAGGRLRVDDGAAGRASHRARRAVRDSAARDRSRGRRRPDGTEKFLFRLPEGQEIETVAIPEGRPPDAVHLVAGRVRSPVRLLRDGAHGVSAQSRGLGDRGAGARDGAARSADRRDERRVHGDGRADDELDRRRHGAHDPEQPARARNRRAPHHGIHRGRAPGNRRARRAPGAVPSRDLDSRAVR